MTINTILSEVQDKSNNTSTTSHKLKSDLWNYFKLPENKKYCGTVVELGTHIGETTRVLSYLFDNVITVMNAPQDKAKKLNSDRDNITYLQFDLYSSWKNSELIKYDVDVVFIDAVHDQQAVNSDLLNSLNYLSLDKRKIFVFDDYGPEELDGIRNVVDGYIKNNILQKEKYIGFEPKYELVNERENRVIKYVGWEGIICKQIADIEVD